MRFKPGQQIVCTQPKSGWVSDVTWEAVNGPDRNEIVTVLAYADECSILLHEYPDMNEGYHESNFEPLMDISELTEILNAEKIEV